MRKDLGSLWEWLPEGALDHDPNAYSKTERAQAPALAIVSARQNQDDNRL
jgi:hypothetical protein